VKRIAIMAPTRGIDMTRYQCDAGANELYLGLDGRAIDERFHNFTFNGRYNQINGTPCQIQTVDELKKTVDYAHSRGVKINYTANIHYLDSAMKKEFDQYIDIGLGAGVDFLIVSNLGVIRYLRERRVTLPIVAGVFLLTPNAEQAKMIQDFGVERIVLPQGITLRDIIGFKEKTSLSIEIFGHFGGGNNCGRCMLLHSPTIDDIGPGCRAAYDVTIEGQPPRERQYFLDAAADCSLCSVPALMRIGVDVIKIVGRESPDQFMNSKITELYNRVQDYALEGLAMEEIKNRFQEEELVWTSMWRPRFCDKNRCRFLDTDITRSYIG
jgi:collagenase-like PrtC family protease